jgi:hypothetical protein
MGEEAARPCASPPSEELSGGIVRCAPEMVPARALSVCGDGVPVARKSCVDCDTDAARQELPGADLDRVKNMDEPGFNSRAR